MEAILNALAAPSAFVADFKRLKALLPFLTAFALSALATVLIAPVTMDLAMKQSNTFAEAGTREYAMFYAFGIGSLVISLAIKWAFATFFLGTVLQFAKQQRQTTQEDYARQELPGVEYSGILQLVAYSGVILAFEGLIKAFAVIVKNNRNMLVTVQDLDVSIGLSLLTTKASVGAFMYAFLGEINPVTLWGYGVLAYWVLSIYRVRRSVAFGAVGGLWLICTILTASMQQFTASMTGAAR